MFQCSLNYCPTDGTNGQGYYHKVKTKFSLSIFHVINCSAHIFIIVLVYFFNFFFFIGESPVNVFESAHRILEHMLTLYESEISPYLKISFEKCYLLKYLLLLLFLPAVNICGYPYLLLQFSIRNTIKSVVYLNFSLASHFYVRFIWIKYQEFRTPIK